MFVPANGSVTHDHLNEPDGFAFEDQAAQDLREGALRLIPTGIPTLPQDLNWPKIEWSREDELPSFPDYIANRWHCEFDNQPIGTPQTFEFEPVSNFLDVDTESGQHQWMRQKGGDGDDAEFWADHVQNETGWVVQLRAQVIEDETGLSKYAGHYIHFDDGTHKERIYLHSDGLYFQYNPDLNIQYDLRSHPREIRIGARQDDLYILLDDGRGYAAFDGFSEPSDAAELTFGTTGVDGHYRTLWDYVNVYTDGLIVDTDPDVPRAYSTTPVTTTTPAFSPKQPVHRWVAAYLETSGDLVNGTTSIKIQYRSSVAPDWTDFTDVDVDEIGQFEILLDNVPTAEDGTDELRLLITQSSIDGLGEPARIEQITILTDFTVGGLRAVPHWGHRAGGNTVVLELTQDSEDMFDIPSHGGERLLVPFDDDYVATVGSDTGIPSGTDSLASGKFGNGVALGSLDNLVDQTLEPFVSLPPFGALGTGVIAEHATAGQLILGQSQVELDGDTYPAQAAYAELSGDGFNVPVDASMRFQLEITDGAVEVSDGIQTHVFYADDYWTAKPVALLSLSSPLSFRAAMPGSSWRVGHFESFDSDTGTIDFGNTYGETGLSGFAADVYVRLDIHGQQEILSTLDGNDGWEIGLTSGGFPYVTVGDGAGTDTVTSLTPIVLQRWTNIALNYRHFDGYDLLQVLVDGVVGAEKITTISTVTDSLDLQVAPSPGVLDQLRIHSGSIDAAEFSQDNGFTAPYFQNATAVPPEDNQAVLNFYENGGAFADASGNGHHAYAPTVGRRFLYRDRVLANNRITAFWHGGQIHLKHKPQFVISLPHTIYGEMALQPNTDFESIVYEKWNAGRTVGLGIYLTTEGVLKVVVNDGVNEWTELSTVLFADQVLRAFAVILSSTQIVIRVDGIADTFTHAIGSLSAATEDATIGYGLMGYLRNVTVRNTTLFEADYDMWRAHAERIWIPTDAVYVDGELVPAPRVIHGGPTRKFVRMPPGEPGYVVIEADSGGRTFFADRPYKYTYGYHRELPERILSRVAGTKSPFRLVTEVPSDGVNLAYVQQPDISVGQNVSVIDLSYKQAENLATYFGGDFILHPPTTGLGGILEYTGQVDTENLLVSNRSAGWKDQFEPAPLFYKYQIGRGRFYVYQPNALTADDAQVIRNGITILADRGTALPFEDFSWDIEVSAVDAHGVLLPDNIFSVTLFSTQKYIPGASIQVQYYAADSLNDWKKIPSFLEIVNTEPIFVAVDSNPESDEYTLRLRDDGSFDIQVGTV